MSPTNRKPVSMSSPNKPVNTFHPSLDPSDILNRQKESLKITIQKAEMEETKRTLRISQQPTKLEKQNLELKFESERQIEKEKINNLLFDLQFLKEKINTGEYSQVLSSRNITSCGNNQGSSNRFAGNIGENDNVIMFWMTFCTQIYGLNMYMFMSLSYINIT
jgi:hypothetical protein